MFLTSSNVKSVLSILKNVFGILEGLKRPGWWFNGRRPESSSKAAAVATSRNRSSTNNSKSSKNSSRGSKSTNKKSEGAQKGGRKERWGARIARFLFLLPLEISLFVLSLGVFSWNFVCVFKAFLEMSVNFEYQLVVDFRRL